MNFLVYSSEGGCSVRPDSSRCKDNGDYYVPDGIDEVAFTPVAYARMNQSGKAIESRFVRRYYDAVGFGFFLYPGGNTIFDRTTVLPMPLYNPITLEGTDNRFRGWKDGALLFDIGMEGIRERLEEAICACSANTSIRRADFVIAELAAPAPLCRIGDTICRINAQFCENEVADIEVKF